MWTIFLTTEVWLPNKYLYICWSSFLLVWRNIELLSSVASQVYYVYGFMLLVFVILIIVTICVTIVGTYFLLNAENYHWQWTSFFSAASTALYVYLYSIYYYHVKTKMSGFFQTSFYFGYTLMFCLGLGILCGEPWNLLLFVSPFKKKNFCSFRFKYYWSSFDIHLFVCRCCWLSGFHPICEENLQKYQMWLSLSSLVVEISCRSLILIDFETTQELGN